MYRLIGLSWYGTWRCETRKDLSALPSSLLPLLTVIAFFFEKLLFWFDLAHGVATAAHGLAEDDVAHEESVRPTDEGRGLDGRRRHLDP